MTIKCTMSHHTPQLLWSHHINLVKFYPPLLPQWSYNKTDRSTELRSILQGHHDALVVQYMGFHCFGTWQYINCQLDELDLICNLETIFNLLCSLWCSIYASRLIINRNSKIRTCLLCYHSETIPLHDNRNLGSPVNKFFPPALPPTCQSDVSHQVKEPYINHC